MKKMICAASLLFAVGLMGFSAQSQVAHFLQMEPGACRFGALAAWIFGGAMLVYWTALYELSAPKTVEVECLPPLRKHGEWRDVAQSNPQACLPFKPQAAKKEITPKKAKAGDGFV